MIISSLSGELKRLLPGLQPVREAPLFLFCIMLIPPFLIYRPAGTLRRELGCFESKKRLVVLFGRGKLDCNYLGKVLSVAYWRTISGLYIVRPSILVGAGPFPFEFHKDRVCFFIPRKSAVCCMFQRASV